MSGSTRAKQTAKGVCQHHPADVQGTGCVGKKSMVCSHDQLLDMLFALSWWYVLRGEAREEECKLGPGITRIYRTPARASSPKSKHARRHRVVLCLFARDASSSTILPFLRRAPGDSIVSLFLWDACSRRRARQCVAGSSGNGRSARRTLFVTPGAPGNQRDTLETESAEKRCSYPGEKKDMRSDAVC
jgi:hypothetical protein